MPDINAFGTWPSPITAELASRSNRGLSALSCSDKGFCLLESRPDEGGRTTLLWLTGTEVRELSPAPLNIRSRVHEYGGGAYVMGALAAFAVNHSDQNIYALPLDGSPASALTEGDDASRFADLQFDSGRNQLIAVREQHAPDQPQEPVNDLVSIDVDNGTIKVLHQGHDFYAAPRLSPDGRRLCFLSWDHPNMPWDGTQLHILDLDATGDVERHTLAAGGAAESVAQPTWLSSDRLLFATDRNGWWNLHVLDSSGLYCVHEDKADYALPLWMFGQQSYAVVSPEFLACQRIENGCSELVLLGIDNGFRSPLPSRWQEFDHLCLHDDGLCFIGQSADQPVALVRLSLDGSEEVVLHGSGDMPISVEYLSQPEAIEFPTRDGAQAYAWFYPPRNPDHQGPADSQPPLLVMTHGGPTAATRRGLHLRVQYYTSRGWAVADLNYRGSTGFGRAYRDALKGQWGVIDVQDAEDLVRHLADAKRIDASRVAIRGGSAGGYTTLAALTFGNTFHAGASHYGIGDLQALAKDTHKFEARYLDSLIGPWPERRDLYIERSPINHAARLSCPVIFMQGMLDKVVPPNQAEAMVEVLRDKKLPVAYLAFEDEAHGFRNPANVARSLAAEFSFFSRVFKLPAPDLIPLDIENLQ